MLISRQGKVRLSRYFDTFTAKEKSRLTREISALVLNRSAKMCNVIEYKEFKIVYKRYASLFFVAAIGKDDNEVRGFVQAITSRFSRLSLVFLFVPGAYHFSQLLTLEIIHHYVEGEIPDVTWHCYWFFCATTACSTVETHCLFLQPAVLDRYFGNVCGWCW